MPERTFLSEQVAVCTPRLARRGNDGKQEEAPRQYGDFTTIRQTRHLRFWRR